MVSYYALKSIPIKDDSLSKRLSRALLLEVSMNVILPDIDEWAILLDIDNYRGLMINHWGSA